MKKLLKVSYVILVLLLVLAVNSNTVKGSTNSSTYTGWLSYDFTGSPYIESGPISFKYPADWKLNPEYYTTPGGSKDIISISITSPSGIEQIVFSNGGRQATLDCDILKKMNTSDSTGRLVCKMINRTPFYLTYTTNVNAEEIYNKVVNSITVKDAKVVCPAGYTCVLTQPTQTPPPIVDTSISSCIKLYVNLSVASTNSTDIKKLQNFLISNKYLSGTASGVFDKTTEDAVKKFQEKMGISPTGFVGPLTRGRINFLCGNIGMSNSNSNGIELKSTIVGVNTASKSYQINLSFLGGTPAKPVVNWKLDLPCNTSQIDIMTVPGASCGTFQMGSVSNNGNVLDKDFYFKNSSGVNQTINATLRGYDSVNNLIGTSNTTLQIPATLTGPITWSQVTLNTPNGGENLVAGKQVYVVWKTTSGTFNLKPDSRTQIYLLKGRSVVASYDYLANDGSEYITLPTNLVTGSDYKISVTVYSTSPEGGQSDESDGSFNITSSSPVSTSNSSISSVYILPSYEDKAGIWDKFAPGIGNINRTPGDWNWFLSLYVPAVHTDISSITITNDSSNEGWSTSVENVFGRAPYPLVVVDSNGKQLNTTYGQNISIPQGSYGTYNFKLYGQMETMKYYSGTLTIKFADGSTISEKVPASKVTPANPISSDTSSVESKKPIISSVKSLAGEEMIVYAGERFSIQGKNLLTYASGNTNIYLGGQKIYASQISNDLAWVVAPNLSAGVYYLYVSNENGSSDYMKVNIRASKVVTVGSSAVSRIVKNVKITDKVTGKVLVAGDSILKNQTYTVSWDAENLNTDSKFSLVLQSSSGLNVYGVIKAGVLDNSTRSYSWTVDSTVPELTELYVSVQLNTGEKANSSVFKVSPSATVASEGFKNVYPITGYPGTKVTLQLNNPKRLSLKQDDFAFGQYGFINFTNSNNEVVTFTVPWDAPVGPYDIVWFGTEIHTIKFNVMSPANTSAAIDWYYQISR